MKKKKDYTNPVTINKDVWFYPNKKSFDFTAYVSIDGVRRPVLFRVTHSKLLKYMNHDNTR